MEKIPCTYCGDFFDPSPRHKNKAQKPDGMQERKMSEGEKSNLATI
jgi:hypothetical protein